MTDLRGEHVTQTNPRGTYRVVAATLRKEIDSGAIADELPSEAAIMRDQGVSRTTVRRALLLLKDEGIVESSPGTGWHLARVGGQVGLSDRVKDLIQDERLEVGDQFPSESDLCRRFGVSRPAIRRILAQMEGAGLLSTTHGKGRTVRSLPNVQDRGSASDELRSH
jgi:DNA-binding GntR family transcriptional regulator